MADSPLELTVPEGISAGRMRSGARRSARGLPAGIRWPLIILGRGIVVIVLVIIITFLLVRIIPGNPVDAIAGVHSTAQTRALLRTELHLNGSLLSQFGAYISALLHGNLGDSVAQQGTTVASIIGSTFPITMTLVLCAIVLSVLVGIPLGLLAGLAGGAKDAGTRILLTIMLTLPPFFLGLLLIWVFALTLPWLPAGGWGGWPEAPRYLVLPSIALAASLIPLIARATRQAARDAEQEVWVEASVARGISRKALIFRHILPNAVLPVVTLVGYSAGVLISGAVVVEAVFGLPGMGQELVDAVAGRDYPTIQGIALVSAIAVVICTAITDLLYLWVDPRTRRA